MDRLPSEIWANHLNIYLSDADFVRLITTCRTFYQKLATTKWMDGCYPISRIGQVVHRYNFTKILYDLKIFQPEYLPQSLKQIKIWGVPKRSAVNIKIFPSQIICKHLHTVYDPKIYKTKQQKGHYLDICELISPKLEYLEVDLWYDQWMHLLTGLRNLTTLKIKKYVGKQVEFFSNMTQLTHLVILENKEHIHDFPPDLKVLELNDLQMQVSLPPNIQKASIRDELKNIPKSLSEIAAVSIPWGVWITQLKSLKIVDDSGLILDDGPEEFTDNIINNLIVKLDYLPNLETLKIDSGIFIPKNLFLSSKHLHSLKICGQFSERSTIRISTPQLTRLNIMSRDNFNFKNCTIDAPLLNCFKISGIIGMTSFKYLEDKLLSKMHHLQDLDIDTDYLPMSTYNNLGANLTRLVLGGIDWLTKIPLKEIRLDHLSKLVELHIIIDGSQNYLTPILPTTLTSLELYNISNRFFQVPPKIRKLKLLKAPYLSKLILPKMITHLTLRACPQLGNIKMPDSLIRISYDDSNCLLSNKFGNYVNSSAKNILYIKSYDQSIKIV
jgi:hypothetical protein